MTPQIKLNSPQLLYTLLLLSCLNLGFSQSKIKGNRDVKLEQTSLSEFNTLSIGSDLEVVLIKSDFPSVTVEADSNLQPVIQFKVKDSILNFEVTKRVTSSKEFKVTVRYTEALRNIVLNNDVEVEAENDIRLPELNLTLNNDAKIEANIFTDKFMLLNKNDSALKLFTNCILKVECKNGFIDVRENSNNIVDINTEELHIKTQDSGELNIEGFAYTLFVDATNRSTVEAKNLLTNVIAVKAAEKSAVIVNASESIKIDASGSSTIELYGEPKIEIDNFKNEAALEKKEL